MAYFSRPQSSSSAVKIVRPEEGDESAKPQLGRPPSLSAQAVNAPVFVPKTGLHVGISASPTPPFPFAPSASPSPDPLEYDSTGGFYSHVPTPFVRQSLNYHLYTPQIPDAFVPSHFISDALREELQRRSETTNTTTSLAPHTLPEELQGYHTLVPLEAPSPDKRKFFSWFSTMYRATNANDGAAYALRRVESFRLMHQAAFGAIESWSGVQHPNIVRVREAFTTRAFNDNSLVVSYDFHPNSQTLSDRYLCPNLSSSDHGRIMSHGIISEVTLWSYIIQIANAIRATHEAGLAVRVVDPSKILVTGKNRIRIGSCGIVDVLMYDTRQDIMMAQQEDLIMFGRLIFALCCGNAAAMNMLPRALDTMGRVYSADIKTLALYLISKPGPHKTISQVMETIGKNRLLREMDEIQTATDRLERELTSELENGRLVRLLCKFGFINERPEFAREPRWSETGDRYIIKLFRDYVFHQVDENGNPVLNLSHVLSCLNKLDTGTDERIMLISRDEQSCLVVSYKEVKSCIDAAFSDLSRASQ